MMQTMSAILSLKLQDPLQFQQVQEKYSSADGAEG